jgi:hypothetical protein
MPGVLILPGTGPERPHDAELDFFDVDAILSQLRTDASTAGAASR